MATPKDKTFHLVVKNFPIDDLVPDKNNPRVNSGAVSIVAESIRQFGFRVPLVIDSDLNIIAGHTRYRAAVMMGLLEVPCTIAADLGPEQLAAFAVAENRASDFSFFDVQKLSEFVKDIPPDFLAAFEIDTILNGTGTEDDPAAKIVTDPTKRKGLDLAPFEKYQYVTIICRTEFDYTNLLTMLALENLQKAYVTGMLKSGASYGRVIEYPDFMEKVARRES